MSVPNHHASPVRTAPQIQISHGKYINMPQNLIGALLEAFEKCLVRSQGLHLLEESMFIRHGDYWEIRYQGQVAILRATRGLDYLCYLLRHPRQDVHVRELLGTHAVTLSLKSGDLILDSRAKAEYKRKIDDLRKDIEDAERFNDFYRAAKVRSEMDAIAEQLAAAVGLGGRDRRSSADAERARSAVTKRVKDGINRIGKIIPSLGSHLAARIKTGYFCSYNPHPDRQIAWRF
ncbi:MAG: hypothetical protein DME33_05605 [Verrucomicrobia bacterium]|nr:MAG: hypothetical protein DME33_05605 [Verrucomicrobiota bacterium]